MKEPPSRWADGRSLCPVGRWKEPLSRWQMEGASVPLADGRSLRPVGERACPGALANTQTFREGGIGTEHQ
jgi:hypothetical protein